MMRIVQNYRISLNFFVNSDLIGLDFGQFGPKINSDLGQFGPYFQKSIGQFGPRFYGVRIDQWSRSELTKVRIDQGPNCPQLRSESGPN